MAGKKDKVPRLIIRRSCYMNFMLTIWMWALVEKDVLIRTINLRNESKAFHNKFVSSISGIKPPKNLVNSAVSNKIA